MNGYTFHEDPAHGWLEVTRAELDRLGIAKQITPYSYQRGPLVYLEEDCDLSTFIAAKRERGEPFDFNEVNSIHHERDAPMRRMDPYRPAKQCERCGDPVTLDRQCGAWVCGCGHHNGLSCCFCGWSADGGDGRRQLIEAGETIGEEGL